MYPNCRSHVTDSFSPSNLYSDLVPSIKTGASQYHVEPLILDGIIFLFSYHEYRYITGFDKIEAN